MQASSFSSIFAVCNLTSEEKWQGTLIPLIATPANRLPLFLGRALFQIFNGMATIAVGFFYADFVFGVDMIHTDFVALAVLLGVNFPVTDLSVWVLPFSYAIPMTYGTTAARPAVQGVTIVEMAPVLLQETLSGIGSLLVGYALFLGFEVLARRRGAFEGF